MLILAPLFQLSYMSIVQVLFRSSYSKVIIISSIVLLFSLSASGKLLDDSELTSHCYHFPAKDFGKNNNVKDTYGSSPTLILNVDDNAIDFTLTSSDGVSTVTLSDLLEHKPVVLLWGHYTCPAFQGFNSDTMFIGSSYEEENLLVVSESDKVTVVHIVGPEPHPIWPYANFDSGSLKLNYWSSIGQPQDFEERMTESVSRVKSLLHEDIVLLVEPLDGKSGKYNNPVWCSYAHAARAAFLIGQDGVIKEAQEWFSRDTMAKAIRSSL